MTSDDKKIKPKPDQKNDAPPKEKGVQEAASSEPRAADTSAGYSRGEGQKPVSKAYKENWNLIFGTKKKR
jgi:hypothetical protein